MYEEEQSKENAAEAEKKNPSKKNTAGAKNNKDGDQSREVRDSAPAYQNNNRRDGPYSHYRYQNEQDYRLNWQFRDYHGPGQQHYGYQNDSGPQYHDQRRGKPSYRLC